MTLRQFIFNNKEEIDFAIRQICPNCPRINNEEREAWILNDEGLYLWARGEGVRV